MSSKILALTKLDKKFIKKKSFYLADYACEFENYEDRSKEIVKFTRTHKLRRKDNLYLLKLKKKILLSLTSFLNNSINKNYSLKFWTTILNHWVTKYIVLIYYKWIFVENISKKKKFKIIKLNFDEKIIKTRNFLEWSDLSETDCYNRKIIQDIILSSFSKKFHFINCKKKINCNYKIKTNINLMPRISIKGIIIKSIKKLINLFSINNKFLFLDTNFTARSNFLLNLKLKQLPFFFVNDLFNTEISKNNITQFKDKELTFKKKNMFECFLAKQIVNDIPLSYTSNFVENYNKIKKIKINTKYFFSSGMYRSNDNFKIWAAHNESFNNKKLIMLPHGPHSDNPLIRSENYFHNKVFWEKTKKSKKNFFLPIDVLIKKHSRKNKKFLFLIPFFGPYFLNNYFDFPFINYPEVMKFIKVLKLKLNNKIYNNLKISAGQSSAANNNHFGYTFLHKNFREKIINDFDYFLDNSKLLVSTYPSTNFFQGLASGPTILVCPEEYTTFKEYKKFFSILKKNKIYFNNHNDAIKHIDEIWHNVDDWWNSKKIQKVINYFYKSILGSKKDSLKAWHYFCKDLELKSDKTKINRINNYFIN